jgi:phage terminase small subunit
MKKIKPTLKQERFVKELTKGKTLYRAGLDAGYSHNTAKNARDEILEKPGTQTAIQKLRGKLEEIGIDNNYIANVIAEGLVANRVISTIGGKQADSETVDFVDVPDHAVRHKFLETTLKIKDQLVEKHEITGKDGEALNLGVVMLPPKN